MQQPSSLSCTERPAENSRAGARHAVPGTPPTGTCSSACFGKPSTPPGSRFVSSAGLSHLAMDFEIHVIGASHLVRCGRWSELLSCARQQCSRVGGRSLQWGPDFSGRQPFRYLDGNLRFEFEIGLLSTRGASGAGPAGPSAGPDQPLSGPPGFGVCRPIEPATVRRMDLPGSPPAGAGTGGEFPALLIPRSSRRLLSRSQTTFR